MPVLDYAQEAPIRDQRSMVGFRLHETPEQVREAWQEHAREAGLEERRRKGDLSTDLRDSRKVLRAYVSGGRWMADCPLCNGGIATWPSHDRGCCLDCGTIYPIEYPAETETREALEALMARPPLYRTWNAHRGETSADLRRENVAHGFHPTRPVVEQSSQVALADLVRVLGQDAADRLRAEGLV